MSKVLIGNAPCSWGALEFEGLAGERAGYAQVLDEIAETGYRGTELGDWGFMPTQPERLAEELARRELALLGAFVPVGLKDASSHGPGEETALKTARLLAAVHELNGDRFEPFLVLADDNGADPVRTRHAGRVTRQMALDDEQWETFAVGTERIARAVKDATGLRTVFHHHAAGYVETPSEVARLLDMTNPALVGLVFDTGHWAYGAGDADGMVESLERFVERIWYMHFKDCDAEIADACRRDEADYFAAVERGVFCELGRGAVDFPEVLQWLRRRDYDGWIVVEQDVLPGMGAPRESARRNREYLKSIGV